MTPIAKNVIVVDEQGNEYEATYPKRAKGLVKNGRARFIDENKICLACPPNEYLEDNMKNKNNINITEEIEPIEAIETVEPIEPIEPIEAIEPVECVSQPKSPKYTIDYCLSMIEKLQQQLTSLQAPLFSIQATQESMQCDEDDEVIYDADVANNKINAAKAIFFEREKTLNNLLQFYKGLYEDLKPKTAANASKKEHLFDRMVDLLNSSVADEDAKAYASSIINSYMRSLDETN